MKTRKSLLVMVLGVVLVSCSRTEVVEPPTVPAILSSPEMDVPVADPGKLHNEVIEAFYQEWPPAGTAGTPEAFCAALARAANSVLPDYGAPPIVQASDMAYLVRLTLDTWKNAGFDPTDPEADPSVILTYQFEQGLVTEDDYRFLTRFIEADRVGKAGTAFSATELATAVGSDHVREVLNVAAASAVIWSGDSLPLPNGTLKSWGTKLVDGLAALSKLRAILRVLGTATASVIFQEYSDDIWDFFNNYPPRIPPTIP